MICFSITTVAQDKGVLKGTVVDKGTGETLPNASISIVGSYYQGMTDFSGEFTILDIKPGTYRYMRCFSLYHCTSFPEPIPLTEVIS